MTAGLSSTGFQLATLADILTAIETDELATIDPTLDTSPDQPLGQINGIMAKKVAEAWELLQTAFGAFDDTKAEGRLLDALCALTGTSRILPSKGSVSVNCTLTIGTVLPPTTTIALDTDPTNRWVIAATYTAAAGGVQPVTFRAENTGAIAAAAGHLTSIVTPIAGWTAATNPLDATQGTALESDTALRLRRRAELAANGACTLPALRSGLLKVAGVQAAVVIENATDAVDGSGRPAHSFEAVIWDGVAPAATDAAVRAAVWADKPAGIEAYGSNPGTLVDDQGVTRYVPFSRAVQDPITVALTVQTDPTKFPVGGGATIAAAILACGGGNGIWYGMGGEIVRLAIMAIALSAVPGVIDVTACAINGSAANHNVAATSIGTFDSSRITVTVT